MGRTYFRHLILASTAFAAVALMAPDAYATCTISTTSYTSGLPGSGSCTFQGGTLTVDVAGSTADLFVLGAGGGTVDQNGKSYTFTGVFSGTHAITFANGSTNGGITLGATNTYTGSTTINAGATVLLSSIGSIASSVGVANNGTLDISATSGASIINLTGTTASANVALGGATLTLNNTGAAARAYGGTITGTGGVTVATGTEAFSGANTYSGTTTIASVAQLNLTTGGSLTSSIVSDAGSLNVAGAVGGTSVKALTGGGTVTLGSRILTLANGSGQSFSGAIGGTGGLTLTTGTQTLSGANTYTGATTINGGTLALSGAGTVATSSNVADAGTFDITQSTGPTVQITSLSGAGTVAVGSNTLELTAAAGTFSGVIQDAGIGPGSGGGLTVDALGTETLSGANTFTGTTTIASTAVVNLTTGGSLANSVVSDAGSLNVAGAVGGTSVKALTGNGTVTLGSKTLTLTNGSNQIFGGIIGGSGGLTLTTGTQTLINTNTYTGATTINGGTLALGLGGSIATSSGVADAGVFDISNSGGASINALNGAGGVSLGGNTLTLNTTGTDTFSGVIADGGINPATGGALSLAGTGTQTLSGVNTYTGATSISKNSTLVLFGSGSIAASSGVADLGVFDISGVGTGPATTASITSLSSSTAHPGTVHLGGNTLVLTNASGNFHGVINGAGGLTVNGGSGETLSGVSSYTGATTIGSGGSLTLTAAESNTTTDVFDSGALSLTGQTLQSLTIYNGASAVSIGTSTITLTNSGVVNSNIAGQLGLGAAGKLILTGGTTTITGGGSFWDTGGVTIQSPAAMVLDGISRSTVTVMQGGQLSGIGTILATGTVQAPVPHNLDNFGTVAPGDAVLNSANGSVNPNALKVQGAFTNESTGILQINVAAITDPVGSATAGFAYGTYGNLAVTGAATLGGTFDLQEMPGFSLYGLTAGETTLYDVLSFGSRTGDFSGLDYNGTACTLESADLYACGAHITIAEDFTTNAGQLNLDITVPEPSSWAMLGSALAGLLGFGFLRRRRA